MAPGCLCAFLPYVARSCWPLGLTCAGTTYGAMWRMLRIPGMLAVIRAMGHMSTVLLHACMQHCAACCVEDTWCARPNCVDGQCLSAPRASQRGKSATAVCATGYTQVACTSLIQTACVGPTLLMIARSPTVMIMNCKSVALPSSRQRWQLMAPWSRARTQPQAWSLWLPSWSYLGLSYYAEIVWW